MKVSHKYKSILIKKLRDGVALQMKWQLRFWIIHISSWILSRFYHDSITIYQSLVQSQVTLFIFKLGFCNRLSLWTVSSLAIRFVTIKKLFHEDRYYPIRCIGSTMLLSVTRLVHRRNISKPWKIVTIVLSSLV